MNKAERLEELAGKFKKVVTPKLLETIGGVTKYDVPVVEDTGQVRTIPMVVLDERTEKEEAYCPSLPDAPSWPVIVKIVIDNAITAGKFKKAVVTEINNEQEFAILTVYKIGTLSITAIVKEQRYVYDDGKAVVIVGYSGE